MHTYVFRTSSEQKLLTDSEKNFSPTARRSVAPEEATVVAAEDLK